MTSSGATPAGPGDTPRGSGLAAAILCGLAALLVATVGIVVVSLGATETGDASDVPRAAAGPLPRTWTVRRGDTFRKIAGETGVGVDELVARNPTVDPARLAPGRTLNLRPDAKATEGRVGPKYHTVRRGDTFASIAAATGRRIDRLRERNPRLKPTTLKPGDRLRLR